MVVDHGDRVCRVRVVAGVLGCDYSFGLETERAVEGERTAWNGVRKPQGEEGSDAPLALTRRERANGNGGTGRDPVSPASVTTAAARPENMDELAAIPAGGTCSRA
jgi:hypothetical protein